MVECLANNNRKEFQSGSGLFKAIFWHLPGETKESYKTWEESGASPKLK